MRVSNAWQSPRLAARMSIASSPWPPMFPRRASESWRGAQLRSSVSNRSVKAENVAAAMTSPYYRSLQSPTHSKQLRRLCSRYADTLFASGISEHLRNHRIQPGFFYRSDDWLGQRIAISADWVCVLSQRCYLSL